MKKITIFLFFAIFFTLHAEEKKEILILNSYHQSMSWVSDIDKAIFDVLKPKENSYVFHIENMDTKRVYTKEHIESLKNLYKNKYKDTKFDLILSSDNNALEFLRNYRDELFGKVPTIFCGINDYTSQSVQGFDNYSGVLELVNPRSTIDLALKLFPYAKRVYVVNDYLVSGRKFANVVKKETKDLEDRVKIEYAPNVDIEELKEILKGLGKDDIVLFGAYFQDKSGRYSRFDKLDPELINIIDSPIFALLEFNVEDGVIGGDVLNGYMQGMLMANIAKDVLRGVDINTIPIKNTNTTRFIFDHLALKKFGIKEGLLPTGRYIKNVPKSFFLKHKEIIMIAMSIIFILVYFIILLLANIKKRKEAQALTIEDNKVLELKIRERTKQMQNSLNDFRKLFNFTKEGIFIFKNNECVDTNEQMTKLLGFESKNDILGKSVKELLGIRVYFKDEGEQSFESLITRVDGKKMPVVLNISMLNKHEYLVGIIDLTKVKDSDRINFEHTKMQALSEMIGNISHHWRQPISVISIIAGNNLLHLELGNLDEKSLKEDFSKISQQTKGLSKMLDDFKKYVEIDSEVKKFNISKTIKKAVFFYDEVIKNSNINVILDLDENQEICTYENDLSQVILKLIENSCAILSKSEDERYIFISLLKSGAESIVLEFKDNGGGVEDELLSKLFEPYFTTSHKSKGKGLSLYMVHKIIDSIEGTIEVENDEFDLKDSLYRGLKFTITIPLVSVNS